MSLDTMDLAQVYKTRLLDQNFGMCITPDDIILPLYKYCGTNYMRPWKLCTENENKEFGSTIENTKTTFNITLDVQHFKPSEISVKTIDREVMIEGKHEERKDDHGFISRQFMRRYTLPMDCMPETVTSKLSSDGVLMVSAEKKHEKYIKSNEKIVPIKMCGPCPKKEEIKMESTPDPAPIDAPIKTLTITNNNVKTTNDKKKAIAEEEHVKKESNKVDSQIMMKEDHCRLLKPELLSEAVSTTEKLITESKKETDELLKLISSSTPALSATDSASDKLEDVLGQCKNAIAELTEKYNETSMSGSTEMTSMSGSAEMTSMSGSTEMTSMKSSSIMTSETVECLDQSSFKSSTKSSTTKTASESVKEMLMCAELKEAAETNS